MATIRKGAIPVPKTLVPCREGDKLLVVIPNYWSKGKTIEEALTALRKHGGQPHQHWMVYSVHPDSVCEGIRGDIMHPKGHPPLKIAESSP